MVSPTAVAGPAQAIEVTDEDMLLKPANTGKGAGRGAAAGRGRGAAAKRRKLETTSGEVDFSILFPPKPSSECGRPSSATVATTAPSTPGFSSPAAEESASVMTGSQPQTPNSTAGSCSSFPPTLASGDDAHAGIFQELQQGLEDTVRQTDEIDKKIQAAANAVPGSMSKREQAKFVQLQEQAAAATNLTPFFNLICFGVHPF